MLKSFFRLILAIQVALYRLTGGKLGGKIQGLDVLLLTTTGRKTGRKLTLPLGYLKDDNGFVIVASNAGSDSHPGWFFNLRSNPRATIEVNDQRFDVQAEIAGREKREQLWSHLVALAPGYAGYATKTRREIPMVILRPATNSS